MNRSLFIRGGGAAVVGAALVGMVAQWEGYREKAYLDLVGVPTIGYGETKGVRLGQTISEYAARKQLLYRIKDFEKEILACIKTDMPFEVQAAVVSLAYNVGSGAVCKGSVAREARKGNFRKACDNLLKYVYAGGKRVKGLVNRRNAEHKFCLKGVN